MQSHQPCSDRSRGYKCHSGWRYNGLPFRAHVVRLAMDYGCPFDCKCPTFISYFYLFSFSFLCLQRWELVSYHKWYNTFAFVSPTSFIVTESGEGRGSLCLYVLPPDDTTATSASPDDIPYIQLYLPEMSPEHQAVLSAHVGPFGARPSALMPAQSVLCLFVTVLGPTRGIGRFTSELCYVISTNVFEQYLSHVQSTTVLPPAEATRTVDWDKWGPANARLLPYIADSFFAARYVNSTPA